MRPLLDGAGRSGDRFGASRPVPALQRGGRRARRSTDVTPRDLGLACAAGALAVDQGSKLILLYAFHFVQMSPFDHVPVLPFFNLVMVWNPGISYGLFPAQGTMGTILLVLFSLAA